VNILTFLIPHQEDVRPFHVVRPSQKIKYPIWPQLNKKNRCIFGYLLALLSTAFCLSTFIVGCAFLPENRTQQIASDEEATPTPIPTRIVARKPTYTVKLGEIVDELTFSGRISAVDQEDLFFRSGGRVRALFFKRNDMVEAGDVIAELEIDNLERELISANLDLERAEVRLESALRELGYDQENAEAGLEIAQIQLAQLRNQIPINEEDVAIQDQTRKSDRGCSDYGPF